MDTREYRFGLVVAGFDPDDDAHGDAFYRRCDDAVVERRGAVAVFSFFRHAEGPEAALASAVVDVTSAVPDAKVARVDDDLVSDVDIAGRLDWTLEDVRQLIVGTCGPGGFPAPAGVVGDGIRVWRWADAHRWLLPQGIAADHTTLAAELVAVTNARLVGTGW